MKKTTTLLLGGMALALTCSAQTFSDDFENYTPGGFLGVQSTVWTTWNGSTGGQTDVQVVTTNASSGSNSIYLDATSGTGGPEDILLPFTAEYNTGVFTYEMDFFVEANKGAYFNFQAEDVPGEVWVMDCFLTEDGTMTISSGGAELLKTTYPNGDWFTITVDIRLNTNTWELLLDGDSKGTFTPIVNQIAGLNLYPNNPGTQGGNGEAGFWVDDVSYDVTPFTLPTLNAAVSGVDVPGKIVGPTQFLEVTVRNLGTDPINSFDLTADYKGSPITNTFNTILLSMESTTVTMSDGFVLEQGAETITVTVSNVNGGTDDEASDNTKIISVDPSVPAIGKVVVAEEATGTWCQWCPRGAVMMDRMEQGYNSLFAGIAVHNNDPMMIPEYDTPFGDYIGGYPSALVDREPEVDPSEIEVEFLENVLVDPSGVIDVGAVYESSTNMLQVSLTTTFKADVSGDWRLVVVLTEDGVTGTGSGYNQSNAYAGGGNGVMGGYENLPASVPASQMVYNHVARVISPSFAGLEQSFPTDILSGNEFYHQFEFELNTEWDPARMHIIGMLIGDNGRIDNAGKATIEEAEANGFVPTGIVARTAENNAFDVFPNPATDWTVLSVTTSQKEAVKVTVYDVAGKIVATQNFGQIDGKRRLTLSTAEFNSGLYLIELQAGAERHTERLMVK